ncbi:CehA/McbA family metallohydrolase [Candidatus Bathyarchaeota archaeon]|nr:CehA/McbA family metallohydrolase [Candidatus Bathyarchaeota archaeon]
MKRSFVNPFKAEGRWYKGNVHAHTTVSDGTRTPETLVKIYKEAGYDFLSITDHSVVADTRSLGGPGFLLIPGEELCVGRSHAGTLYHIVGLGVAETMPFKDFNEGVDPQKVVDHINEVGGICILAHPYWSGLSHLDLARLTGFHGVEIYNTSCDYERNTGLSAAHVDGLIAAGRKPWIYATDDHHGADRPNLPLDACGAWINVKAKQLTRESIMESIRGGLFYSSTGPEIKDISIDGDGLISVECSPVKTISFVSTPSLGMKFYAEDEPLTEVTYPGRPGETYVRVEATDYEGRTAWSNPIYNLL